MPDLARTRAHLEKGLGENLWTGYSLAIRTRTLRQEIAGGDVPAPSSPVPWYSAGKPITAVGVLRVLGSSPALWPKPMSATFPELAGSYAGALTLENILTHQTGLRILETNLRGTLRENLEYFARVTPSDFNLSAGQAAYDPAGGWWLLGQWLERQTGKPWAAFLENDLLQPAELMGLKYHAPATTLRERRAGKWAEGEPGTGPGAGLTGPSMALALFYEKLWQGELLPPTMLERKLRPARVGKVDATFGHAIDFGLGVILNSNRYGASTVPYGFGSQAGTRSFGHGGARSSMAFADPEAELAAAVFLNGRVPETEHQPRMRTLLDLLRSELT